MRIEDASTSKLDRFASMFGVVRKPHETDEKLEERVQHAINARRR